MNARPNQREKENHTMSNLILAAREQVAALTQSAYEKAAAAGVLPAGSAVAAKVDIPKDCLLYTSPPPGPGCPQSR